MLLVVGIVTLVSGGTVAVAAQLITSKDIKNNTIKPKDLTKGLRKQIARKRPGPSGVTGPAGATGATGPAGTDGTATYAGPHWSLIDRNTEGSPVAELRAGPYGAATGQNPPAGVGSLGLVTADNTEKVAWGNQVDFNGNLVSGLNQVGFSYFVTGEDLGRYVGNTPNITLEINPHVAGKTYTSMVYVPPNPTLPAGQGSGWISDDADANAGGTSGWWFTNGSVAAATNCTQATFCSLAQAKAALVANQTAPATIYTVAIAKGKDYQYQGAVDNLRINSTTYNFEPFGVEEVSTP